jgi:FkbM family methyltransferase
MAASLVFDVGACDGSDTAHYLSRGYRVVTIEANPAMADHLRSRFRDEIERGECVVLNVAVGEKEGEATFYVTDTPALNSFDLKHIERHGAKGRPVRVRSRPFAAILADYDLPEFVKIDIEGSDHLCIEGIPRDRCPQFISFEAGDDSLRSILHLAMLGYSRFRLVDQRGWTTLRSPEPGGVAHTLWSARQVVRVGLRRAAPLHRIARSIKNRVLMRRLSRRATNWALSSGPMPMDVPATEWMSLEDLLYVWENARRSGVLDSSWFDVHAAR